jgi:quercetin dioxygenase-like cupin family protein
MDSEAPPLLRSFRDDFRWERVVLSPYKEEGDAPFRAISRQELFKQPDLACELRYFEMAPGGYSTLERHEHAHAVMVLRGEGHCLLDRSVRLVRAHDLIAIPSFTWHQFRATSGVPLGFLCMVNRDRDRPQLPTEADLAEFRKDPALAAFLAGTPVLA